MSLAYVLVNSQQGGYGGGGYGGQAGYGGGYSAGGQVCMYVGMYVCKKEGFADDGDDDDDDDDDKKNSGNFLLLFAESLVMYVCFWLSD